MKSVLFCLRGWNQWSLYLPWLEDLCASIVELYNIILNVPIALARQHHTIIGVHVHRRTCTQMHTWHLEIWVGMSNLITGHVITDHYLIMRRNHLLPFLAPLCNHDLLGKIENSGRIIWQHYRVSFLFFCENEILILWKRILWKRILWDRWSPFVYLLRTGIPQVTGAVCAYVTGS
jgi:hypothetical protein